MTDITDRHTLRRMSWSELITAGQEAEFQHDYERARIVWSFALHVATTTINKNLAIAHIRRCDTVNATMFDRYLPFSCPLNTFVTDAVRFSPFHHH